jgi:hypothetical protein
MRSPVDILSQVQQAVWRRNAEQPRAGYHEYIAVSPDRHGVSVDFWGDAHEDSYAELLHALRTPEVAAQLQSLTLRGPDEGRTARATGISVFSSKRRCNSRSSRGNSEARDGAGRLSAE